MGRDSSSNEQCGKGLSLLNVRKHISQRSVWPCLESDLNRQSPKEKPGALSGPAPRTLSVAGPCV